LLGFGECFSSRLVREALCAAGTAAANVDARTCLVTDARHGQASPLWEETNLGIQEILTPILAASQVPVLGGFIAATVEGIPTTLGRGGSDFSAAILAAALSASRLEIWTDVDGIMTTDPRLCEDARVIRKLSFEEAAELARWGAKVLHPATLAPAMRENIPVYVRNSRRPETEGTEIVARAKASSPVTAITAKRNIAAVEIESPAGIGSELLRAIYAAFDPYGCVVEVMTASPGRISLLVDSAAALPDLVSDLRGLASVKWENHKALVCLVGENIRRQADIASRALSVLSEKDSDGHNTHDVRVRGQDASDRTLSFLIDDTQVEESVQRLHQLFFQPREPVSDWGGLSSAFCQAG
jgi:aspartate kinase